VRAQEIKARLYLLVFFMRIIMFSSMCILLSGEAVARNQTHLSLIYVSIMRIIMFSSICILLSGDFIYDHNKMLLIVIVGLVSVS
jgi:hypothetical protein